MLEGGARRKNLNQFDNQQTKRTAQRKLAELDFTAAIRGYQYDCGDYILRVGGVFIKGNNSHSLILEVEYLPPISTSAHYTSAAEAIARELAAAAFGVGAASTRRNTGSQDHQRRMDSKDGSVGGGQASVDTHFIDVELRGSWSPPTGSSTPQVLPDIAQRPIFAPPCTANHSFRPNTSMPMSINLRVGEPTTTGATTLNGGGWVRGGGGAKHADHESQAGQWGSTETVSLGRRIISQAESLVHVFMDACGVRTGRAWNHDSQRSASTRPRPSEGTAHTKQTLFQQ